MAKPLTSAIRPTSANFFVNLLGYQLEAAELLAADLVEAVPRYPSRFAMVNRDGYDQYAAIIELRGPAGATLDVFTVWQIAEEGRPTFATARAARQRDRLRLGL